ncbi:hypothetical protein [Streptomyces sp. NPDC021224]|uniref:hypothetical protein n=1 Tax=unclassified Streptomyces TaxID=2593676 RepID=UPI003787C71A
MRGSYDLFLAVDLRPDLPGPALRELRRLLDEGGEDGEEIPAEQPASADWKGFGGAWSALDGGAASHAFAGADVSALIRAVDRPALDGSAPWALTVRPSARRAP